MKSSIKTAFAALAIATAVAVPVSAQSAYSQLAANAGLTPSEAEGLTLNQIAQHFFNRDESNQNRQAVRGEIKESSAGDFARSQLRASTRYDARVQLRPSARNMPAPSLREFAAANYNRGQSGSDRITVTAPTPGMSADRSQLAASAGLGIDGAEGRSLNQLAATFFNRREMGSGKQWVRD